MLSMLLGVGVMSVALYLLLHSLLVVLAAVAVGVAMLAWRIGVRNSIGVFLLLMIVQYLVIALLQFYGVRQYREISAIKDVILVAAPLWYVTQVKSLQLLAADVVLALALFSVLASQIFHPGLEGLRVDWEWVLPYFLGRVMVVGTSAQAFWAKCAVWTCAVAAILGAWEVFVLGPEPRTLLVNATLGERHLDSTFFATGYTGLRAASTTVAPLTLAGFCMIALFLWWAYMKNPLPALLVGAGLILTVTRSATVMVVVGVSIIALRRKERARIIGLIVVFCIAIAIAIPTLDLDRFVKATFSSGADVSLEGHQASLSQGVTLMLENPLGTGAGTVGPRTILKSTSAHNIESSYLTIAIEYGIVPGILFAGFVLTCLWQLFRVRSSIGYAAFATLLGFALLLGVSAPNQDLPLNVWVWFLVGQGIKASSGEGFLEPI
jgi:hypothetical protein